MAKNRAESGKIITATAKAGYKELEKYKNALEKQMKKEHSLFIFKSNKFRTRQEKKLGKSFESSAAEGDQSLEKKAEFPSVETRRKKVSKAEKGKACLHSKVNGFGRIFNEKHLHIDCTPSVQVENEEDKNNIDKSDKFALPAVNDGHLNQKNSKTTRKNSKDICTSVDSEKFNNVTKTSKASDKTKEFGKPTIIFGTAVNGVDDKDVMGENPEKKSCEVLDYDIAKEEDRKVGSTCENSEASRDKETKVNQNSGKSLSLPEISVNTLRNSTKHVQAKTRKHGSKRTKRGGSSGAHRELVKSSSFPDVCRKSPEVGRKHSTAQKPIGKAVGMPSNRGKDAPKKESRRAAANYSNLPVVLVPRSPSDVMPKGSEVKVGWSVVCRVLRMKRRFVKRKGRNMLEAWDWDRISNPRREDETNRETVTTQDVWESLKNCRYLRLVSQAQT